MQRRYFKSDKKHNVGMMLCFPSCNLISTESFGAEVLLLHFAFLKGSLKMQRQYFLKCFTFPRCNSSEPFA